MPATIDNVMVKPFHFTDIHDLYITGGELNSDNDIVIDQSAEIAALKAAQDTIIDNENTAIDALNTAAQSDTNNELDNLIAQYPFADLTAFTAAVNASRGLIIGYEQTIMMDDAGVKADLQAAVDAELNPTFTETKADIALDMQTDFNAAVTAGGFTYLCPQCGTVGRVATYNEDGTPTGEYIESDLCNGLGFTDVQYKRDPNSNGYILS